MIRHHAKPGATTLPCYLPWTLFTTSTFIVLLSQKSVVSRLAITTITPDNSYQSQECCYAFHGKILLFWLSQCSSSKSWYKTKSLAEKINLIKPGEIFSSSLSPFSLQSPLPQFVLMHKMSILTLGCQLSPLKEKM